MDTNKPLFLQLTDIEKKASIEALIFSAEEPLSLESLFKLLISNELPIDEQQEELIDADNESKSGKQISISDEIHNKFEFTIHDIQNLIEEINKELIETNRPFQIINIANGYSYSTRPEYGMLIQQLTKSKLRKRLSQAAMEALAIIAYRQPVTKAEIEQIRGVSSIEVVNTLIEKHLVEIVGRKEALGKPLLYGTNKEFLRVFGLKTLDDLPKLRELEEIPAESFAPEENIEIVVEETSDEFKEVHEQLNDDFDFKPEIIS